MFICLAVLLEGLMVLLLATFTGQKFEEGYEEMNGGD
jgi:hypothetical protein